MQPEIKVMYLSTEVFIILCITKNLIFKEKHIVENNQNWGLEHPSYEEKRKHLRSLVQKTMGGQDKDYKIMHYGKKSSLS